MNLPSLWRRQGRDPFGALSNLQRDFERLFDELTDVESRTLHSEFLPSCELIEDKANYLVRFDMPGVKKEDVNIQIDENHLTVSAERREEKTGEDRRSRFSEISYGSYQRSFSLPTLVDAGKIDAKFENGVLTLTMPKLPSSKAKQISVH